MGNEVIRQRGELSDAVMKVVLAYKPGTEFMLASVAAAVEGDYTAVQIGSVLNRFAKKGDIITRVGKREKTYQRVRSIVTTAVLPPSSFEDSLKALRESEARTLASFEKIVARIKSRISAVDALLKKA